MHHENSPYHVSKFKSAGACCNTNKAVIVQDLTFKVTESDFGFAGAFIGGPVVQQKSGQYVAGMVLAVLNFFVFDFYLGDCVQFCIRCLGLADGDPKTMRLHGWQFLWLRWSFTAWRRRCPSMTGFIWAFGMLRSVVQKLTERCLAAELYTGDASFIRCGG